MNKKLKFVNRFQSLILTCFHYVQTGNFSCDFFVFSLDTLILYHHTFQTVIQNKRWKYSVSHIQNWKVFLFYSNSPMTRSRSQNLIFQTYYIITGQGHQTLHMCAKINRGYAQLERWSIPNQANISSWCWGLFLQLAGNKSVTSLGYASRIITPMITSIRATIIPSQLIQT